MHFLPARLNAEISARPGCNKFYQARMQYLHIGLMEKIAVWPLGNDCIQARMQNLHVGQWGIEREV
jgi:hypothetical protein